MPDSPLLPAAMPRSLSTPDHLRWRRGRVACGVVVAAIAVLACTRSDEARSAEIPGQMLDPFAPEYALAVDSARIAARRYVAGRYLPSVSVAVSIDGELVWAEAFGWADLSTLELATPQTLYPVGSISKPLTATAAGLLYERGQLDFDVPIQTYLPDFPEKRWPVTTRQLMGHIAGMRNSGSREALRREEPCLTAYAALALFADDTLNTEPGSEYSYSNPGFQIVGAIVEAAAGEPYLDYMEREVFAAIGLRHTLPDEGPHTSPERATYYLPSDYSTLRRAQDIDMSCPMAAGGFLSTPSDLVRFGFAMLNAEILEQETVDLFWTPQRLDNGEPTSYGMGWGIGRSQLGDDESATTPTISHGGAVLGGRASLLILPEEGMVVASMTNSRADPSALARRVAAHFRARPAS